MTMTIGYPRVLTYSCSGCSNVAQAANALAVRLDREGHAEMSCIAGVAAGVPSLVRLARSCRPILAIDGCPLHCCKRGLEIQQVQPTVHLELTVLGIPKRQHEELGSEEMEVLWREIVLPSLGRAQQTEGNGS